MPAPSPKLGRSSEGPISSHGGRWREFGGRQLARPKEVLARVGSAASLPTRKPGGSPSGSTRSQGQRLSNGLLTIGCSSEKRCAFPGTPADTQFVGGQLRKLSQNTTEVVTNK